jgi:excinuclease UvrABC nuclease subunit
MKVTIKYVREFTNLHIAENLEQAKLELKAISGIYCILHIHSGTMYIGPATNLFGRIMSHIKGSSNSHLQRAIAKYGISDLLTRLKVLT